MSSEPLTEEDSRGRSECGLTGEGGDLASPSLPPPGRSSALRAPFHK